jgi:glycosyltransferase involved in cell wall biosynthesis
MRILLISDFGIEHTPGGAQRSNQIIVEEGIARGHDVRLFHYDSNTSLLLDSYDFVISSNLEVISRVYPKLVENIPLLKNHVRLEHDSNSYWNNDFRKYFWSSCIKSFFLSEFHLQFFKELYGDIFNNVVIVPDPIDSSFYDMKLKRSDDIGYIGFFHELKGTGNFVEFANDNMDKKFLVAGWGSDEWIAQIKGLDNVKFLGKIEYRDMRLFYNMISSLYYNPICNEPFCRSVGEALMCGTKIIGGSNKIGSLEMFKRCQTFREKCINAASDFWKIIENV